MNILLIIGLVMLGLPLVVLLLVSLWEIIVAWRNGYREPVYVWMGILISATWFGLGLWLITGGLK